MLTRTQWLAGGLLLSCLACGGRSAGSQPLAMTFTPPPSAMPIAGSAVTFQVEVAGGDGPVHTQWLLNGVALAGASAGTLTLKPVSYGDNGTYQAQVSDRSTTLLSAPFTLEPVDKAWVVTSAEDSGPGTLREALAETAGYAGRAGIQFAIPGEGPVTITLQSELLPITQNVCILGGWDRPLTLDGGKAHRPFFVAGGTLILDHFTVAHGLGKGGDGLGGGGGAAGMGGALFLSGVTPQGAGGTADLRRMTFDANLAQGGASAPGTAGLTGGGGGFGADYRWSGGQFVPVPGQHGGDSSASGGKGGDGGFLMGQGGAGELTGHFPGGSTGLGWGAGGGAAAGGPVTELASTWPIGFAGLPGTDNLSGGDGTWGAGGGFSVGPLGGGGNAGIFGGGGGGAGGSVLDRILAGVGTRVFFQGSAGGAEGMFGGKGGMGDGQALLGQGGGGGGFGGAVFVCNGTLRMTQCQFTHNEALPGKGYEDGLGLGGAIFIYPPVDSPPSLILQVLAAQTYAGNVAPDIGAESVATDNADYYVNTSGGALARELSAPLALRYRLYRLRKALGLPVVSD